MAWDVVGSAPAKQVVTRADISKHIGSTKRRLLMLALVFILFPVFAVGLLALLGFPLDLVTILSQLVEGKPAYSLRMIIRLILVFAYGGIGVVLLTQAVKLYKSGLHGLELMKTTLSDKREECQDLGPYGLSTRNVYYLRFSAFGEFCLGKENYGWTGQPMGDVDVYISCETGDSFYLLIHKRDGQIEEALPAAYFELAPDAYDAFCKKEMRD